MVHRTTGIGGATALALVVGTRIAAGASSSDAALAGGASAGLVVQAAASPSLLDYFTFVPQALLLLIAVGLRRYLLADAALPWWLDASGLWVRVRRLPAALTAIVSRSDESSGASTAGSASESSASQQSLADDSETASAADSATDRSPAADATSSAGGSADATTASSNGGSGTGRGSEPAPERLALSYEQQRLVVGDGDTVDEEVRAMLRAAGHADHAKWIDDRHLHFVRDEHGFTLVVEGENLTRLNGERLRAGERARVYPGDEIELSGVISLSVDRA